METAFECTYAIYVSAQLQIICSCHPYFSLACHDALELLLKFLIAFFFFFFFALSPQSHALSDADPSLFLFRLVAFGSQGMLML